MDSLSLWPHGPVLERCQDAQPVCTDSVLLADFTRLNGVRRAADLGAGSGVLAIILAFRSQKLTVDCVELSPEAAGCCMRNVARNGLSERVSVLNRDLRTLTEAEVGKYQLIITNPPYYPLTGGESPRAVRREARQEQCCTLPELADTSARLLGDGGRFTMVYPAARLAEAIYILTEAGLTPKRLRLVQASAGSSPSLALLECRRRGGPGLTAEPTLILKTPEGADTPEVSRIYRRRSCDGQ